MKAKLLNHEQRVESSLYDKLGEAQAVATSLMALAMDRSAYLEDVMGPLSERLIHVLREIRTSLHDEGRIKS